VKIAASEEVTVAQPLVSWTDRSEMWSAMPYQWILEAGSDANELFGGTMALPFGPFGDRTEATEYLTGGLLKVEQINRSMLGDSFEIHVRQSTHYAQ